MKVRYEPCRPDRKWDRVSSIFLFLSGCRPDRKWDRVSSIFLFLSGGLEDGWMSSGGAAIAILMIDVEIVESRHGFKLGRSTYGVYASNCVDDYLGALGILPGSCDVIEIPVIA